LAWRYISDPATVLDGDPAPTPKKGGTVPSIFGSCLLWPNSWMDQDVTLIGTEAGLGAGDIALHGDQVPPPPKKGA